MDDCNDAGVVGLTLLRETDKTEFQTRFATLVELCMASDETTLAGELCARLIARAGELGFDADTCVRYQTKLLTCMLESGDVRGAQPLADDLVARVDDAEVSELAAVAALIEVSRVAARLGDAGRARSCLDRARRPHVLRSNLDLAASHMEAEAHLAIREGRCAEARQAYVAAEGIWELLGNKKNALIDRFNVARVDLNTRHLSLAEHRFAGCVTALRELGSRRSVATTQLNLGICRLLLGKWEAASRSLEEALRIARASGFRATTCHALLSIGALRCRMGFPDDALATLRNALELTRELGLLRDEAIALEFIGIAEHEAGDDARALECYDQAIRLARKLSSENDCLAELMRHRAEALNGQGEHHRAREAAEEGLAVSEAIGDPVERAASTRELATALAGLRRLDAAEEVYRRAVSQARQLEDPFERAKTLSAFGRFLAGVGCGTPGVVPVTTGTTGTSGTTGVAHGGATVGGALEYLREAEVIYDELGLDDRLEEVRRIRTAVTERRRDAEVHAGEFRVADAASADSDRADAAPGDARALADDGERPVSIITRSRDMLAILDQIRGVAPSSLPVLILGERGTGKELIAHEVHRQSGRPRERMITVNCAAIPTELQDSELFGHRKGSFTGAVSDRDGLFEQADGGTIFLDEIGDLALEAQAKLLRVLESGESRKIGEHRCRFVDARVVAATNHDLVALAASGRFRADLYDRLEGVRFELPPLRARRDDIDLLVEHYLSQLSATYGKQIELPQELRRIYRQYEWPGNVRELKLELHRVVLLTGDHAEVDLATSHVAAKARQCADDRGPATPSGGLVHAVDETERRLIVDALLKAGGNRAQAARMLHMSRTTLIGKIKRLRIA